MRTICKNRYVMQAAAMVLTFFACASNSWDHKRVPGGIEQYHNPPGCVPKKNLAAHFKSGRHRFPGITSPSWCKNDMIPAYLSDQSAEKTKAPFTIRFRHFKLSNAINISIESDGHIIKNAFVTVRNVEDEYEMTLGRPVGRFIPNSETAIVCCDQIERNGIEIVPANSTKKVQVVWLPNGDYEGLIVAMATVVDEDGKYWAGIKSEPTTALE